MEQKLRAGRDARLRAEQDCVLLKNRVALLRKETEREQRRCQELVEQTKLVVQKRKRWEGDRQQAVQQRQGEEQAAFARRQALLGQKEAQRSRIRNVASAVLREKQTLGAQEREYKGLLADARGMILEQHSMDARAKHDIIRHTEGAAQAAKLEHEEARRMRVRRELEQRNARAARELMRVEGEAAQLETDEIELMRQLEFQREQTQRAEERLQQVKGNYTSLRTSRTSTSAPPGAFPRMPPLNLRANQGSRMTTSTRSVASDDPFEWRSPPVSATHNTRPRPPVGLPCGPREQDARPAVEKTPPQAPPPEAARFTYTTADGQVIDVSDSEDETEVPPTYPRKPTTSETSTALGTPASCSPSPAAPN